MDFELNRFGQSTDKRPLITQSTSYNPLIIPTERRTKAGLWQRSSPLCLLVLAIALSAVPGSLQWTSKTYGSNTALYKWSIDDRAVLQVIIQIIAAILAFLWTYSVCLAFNLTLRPLLAERRISVSTLRLCATTSSKAFDLNLPLQLMLVSALVYGVTLLPSWFWTGALTPQIVSRTVELNGSLVAPNTGSGSYPFLQDPETNVISAGCRGAPQTNGSFTTCPGGTYPGHVIDSMGQVSNFEAGAWNHSKFDSSGYTYTNRSYGVGAGIGLHPTPDLGAMYGYKYQELGYLTSAKCAYNASSAWFLTNSTTDSPLGTPNIFWAEGMRPNDDWDALVSSAGYTMWNYGDKTRRSRRLLRGRLLPLQQRHGALLPLHRRRSPLRDPGQSAMHILLHADALQCLRQRRQPHHPRPATFYRRGRSRASRPNARMGAAPAAGGCPDLHDSLRIHYRRGHGHEHPQTPKQRLDQLRRAER